MAIIKLIKKLLHSGIEGQQNEKRPAPTILARSEHIISRENINNNAIKVLHRLNSNGYRGYLVGGGVRDLLLGYKPKDFDVATDAHPEQIQELFRNCRLIGRRFRLAHVYFSDGIIEVATFRARDESNLGDRRKTETGMLLRDNVYGSMEDDAWRRDFTVNALYYDILDYTVIDYTQGMQDLQQRLIRMIGDPVQRYHEDPIRILRAIRLAAKLNFTIHKDTEKPIFELGGLLQNVPAARLLEELLKLYQSGKAEASFKLLQHYGLFAILFAQTEASLIGAPGEIFTRMISQMLKNADERTAENKSLNPAFLFAVLLWAPLQQLIHHSTAAGLKPFPAWHAAMDKVINQQLKSVHVPKRLTKVMQEIWMLQYRFSLRQGRRINAVFYHPRFRAAYDFLLLRTQAGEPLQELSEWWAQFQEKDDVGRREMIRQLQVKNSRRPRKASSDS